MSLKLILAGLGFVFGLCSALLSVILIFMCTYTIECKGIPIWVGISCMFVSLVVLVTSAAMCMSHQDDNEIQYTAYL
jgi:hypothetical protein